VRLLDEIDHRHRVPYEIKELSRRAGIQPGTWIVDDAEEKEVYERDFRPRAAILRYRTGESVRKLLRSKSGGYFVAGTVTITQNGQVEWLASHSTAFPRHDRDPTIGFLKALLEDGPPLLERLTPPVPKGVPELKILDAFIASRPLDGEYRREVRVGPRRFETPNGVMDWRKSIDLVCTNSRETWILEAKTALNYEALGEVLTYDALYVLEHPDEEVKLGIICGAVDEDILEACKTHRIAVFQVGNNATVRLV
jgi:hypothetical protein